MKKLKKYLLEIVTTSDILKKNISNLDRKRLIEGIYKLPDNKINKLCKILEKKSNIDFERIGRKIENKLLLVAFLPIPASESLYIAYKLATAYNYKCSYNCRVNKDDLDKTLCYKKCNVLSINKAINEVKKEMNDCWYEKDPEKCKKDAIDYLHKLYDRLGNAKIKLKHYQIKIHERNKKNAKLQQN